MAPCSLAERVAQLARRLHDRAIEETGLTDFGPASYEVGLETFLRDVGSNPLLDDPQSLVDDLVVSILRSRLYSEAGWASLPSCRANPLPAPLVIMGIPRTGTTLLHKLLAQDPRFQVLENWLIDQPMPRPPRETWSGYPGYRIAVARVASRDEAQRTRHNIDAEEADECVRLMSQEFVGNLLGGSFPVAEFDRWWMAQDQTPIYRRYADNLRLIGSAQPDQPWLLKNPSHVGALGALLAVFPDARLVQTHRDPWEAISSVASLVSGRRRLLGRSFDPIAIGKRELTYWSWAVEDAHAVRERTGVEVHDVDYRRLVDDPVAVAREMYAHAGLELLDEVEATMRNWIAANPQDKFGLHRYRGEDFGLTPERVRAAFAPYIVRHGLDTGRSAS